MSWIIPMAGSNHTSDNGVSRSSVGRVQRDMGAPDSVSPRRNQRRGADAACRFLISWPRACLVVVSGCAAEEGPPQRDVLAALVASLRGELADALAALEDTWADLARERALVQP